MQYKRIAVLRGGPSDEHDISMLTGQGVLKALNELGYYVKDVVIDKKGDWLYQGYIRPPEQVLLDVDVVFIALHGEYGEDGTVQRIIERFGIPYTGSGPLASAIALDKHLTKEHLKPFKIKLPKHLRLTRDGVSDIRQTAESIKLLFGPQYVIKALRGGSSRGTVMVENQYELANELQKLFEQYEAVIVEERIIGKEATVGIVEKFRGTRYYQLPVIEIVPPTHARFFSKDVKYSGETEETCPGRFSKGEKEELAAIAELVHQTLNLRQYSRSDFMVNDSGIYFLEVNTLPGLTPNSLVPVALSAVGASYNDLVGHLVETACL